MRQLIKKFFILAILPVFLFYVFLYTRPIDQFNFRMWECLKVKESRLNWLGPFYPSVKYTKIEVGDLAPYSKHAVIKNVNWETDEYGFRNKSGIDLNQIEIVVGGDSNVAGSSLSQEELLTSLLVQKNNQKVYNLGEVNFSRSLYFIDEKKMKIKSYIFVIVERDLINLPIYKRQNYSINSFNSETIRSSSAKLTYLTDFLNFNMFQNFKEKHGLYGALVRLFTPINEVNLVSYPAEEKMIFYQGLDVLKYNEDLAVEKATAALKSYKKELDLRGVDFIFVVVPNKESIYTDKLSFLREPQLLSKFYKRLDFEGINYVDIYSPFREKYVKNKTISHHMDDTHWNSDGVNTAYERITNKLDLE